MVRRRRPLACVTRLLCAVAVACGLAASLSQARPRAQAAAAPDLQAACLLNFARFTEWPDGAKRQQLVICVYGDDRLGDALLRALRGQTIGGRSLVLSRVKAESTVVHCQVLFVAGGLLLARTDTDGAIAAAREVDESGDPAAPVVPGAPSSRR